MVSKYWLRSASTTSVWFCRTQHQHRLDRFTRTASRPIAVRRRVHIRLEDRLQHQFCRGLHHPVPYRWDAERALAAAGLWDHHPPHRLAPIRLRSQLLAEPGQPVLQPRRLDPLERHPVHAWRALVGACQIVRMAQNVRPPDLVVEQIEPEAGSALALPYSFLCKVRIASGVRRLIANHPTSSASKTRQKSGSFPPPALPSFIGTTTLSDSRTNRCPTAPLRPLPSSSTGLPRLRDPLSRRAVPITPVDRSRCLCRLLPQIVLPSPNSGRVGVHNFPFEACSGFTRVTARQFAPPPKATFVAGLRYCRSPDRTACQLPGQPTIARVGLAPTR